MFLQPEKHSYFVYNKPKKPLKIFTPTLELYNQIYCQLVQRI